MIQSRQAMDLFRTRCQYVDIFGSTCKTKFPATDTENSHGVTRPQIRTVNRGFVIWASFLGSFAISVKNSHVLQANY